LEYLIVENKMKKIQLTAAALLLLGNMAMAQTPANRTATTIATDALGQMPAQNSKDYKQLMQEFISSGNEGIQMLVKMLDTPYQGDHTNVDYAISGITNYVSGLNDENARLALSKTYLEALQSTDKRETQAFLIRQLQRIGKDECIEPLTGYLANEKLSGPSARALSSIGSNKAGEALLEALKKSAASSKSQRDICNALAEIHYQAAEPFMLTLVKANDLKTHKCVINALAHLGTKASLKILADEAQKANYTFEKTGANEAFIALLKRVAQQGDTKEVTKYAEKLYKNSTKINRTQSRDAAIQILLTTEPEKRIKLLLKALKDSDKAYRNTALNLASPYADQEMYIKVLKDFKKFDTDAQVDILNWMGHESKMAAKHELIKNLELRFDLTAKQLILAQLNSTEYPLVEAAVWALTRIGDTSVIPSIASLLDNSDKQIVLLAQDALMAFNGDISQNVVSVMGKASDSGKIACLELLANRKANQYFVNIIALIDSPSPAVQKAAYTALKDVVSENDFTQLCGLLETAPVDEISAVQEAIIYALRLKPASQQVQTISSRMLQAGSSNAYLYYKILASTEETDALSTIEKGFDKESGKAKDFAFDALLTWNDTKVCDKLYRICEANDTYFEQALSRYVQLVSDPKFTGENRLLSLRKVMEIAQTDKQKSMILSNIGNTGTYMGLFYAYPFLHQTGTQGAAASAIFTIAQQHPEYTGDNIKSMLNEVKDLLTSEDARYERSAIEKMINEMPDEKGFVSIFNGNDLQGWKGLVENPIKRAQMSESKQAKAQAKADDSMRQDWKVEDGTLTYVGDGYDNLCTQKKYGDFELYLDWKLDPAGPQADAGVYLRGTPQVQIWDTARTNVGAQVGSGGLYNNSVNRSTPLCVADNKLGEWNSFYIKMIGDRVTVYLNGILVTDNVILENYWDRTQPIFPLEQIELQAHGSKVYYRDIYVKELKQVEPSQLTADEKKEGFKMLFDGTNMHEWTGDTKNYQMENGTITMHPSKSFGGNLYTKEEFANFDFKFEFKLTPGANNGLGIRTPLEGDAAYVGMELQIIDNSSPIYANLHVYQYHGSVYGVIPAKRGALKPVGEWNTERVIADGDHIKIIVNGIVVVDGNIREAGGNGTLDHKQHPGLFNKTGHIGFLGHGHEVSFRNIRVKKLK